MKEKVETATLTTVKRINAADAIRVTSDGTYAIRKLIIANTIAVMNTSIIGKAKPS